jgi:hypothetical protein
MKIRPKNLFHVGIKENENNSLSKINQVFSNNVFRKTLKHSFGYFTVPGFSRFRQFFKVKIQN